MFESLVTQAPALGSGGMGLANADQLEALQKALVANAGIDPATFTSGRAMTVESLDSTLVQRLFTEKEAQLFRKLKHSPVGSVVHQWAERTDVGGIEGAFTSEGGDSVKSDQTLGRKFTEAKYMQFHQEATLQAVLTSDRGMTLEGAIALETNAGALKAIKATEHYLFMGNSDLYPLQYDGILKQVEDYNADGASSGNHIIDVRAKASTETFENAVEGAVDEVRVNYSMPDCLFGDIGTMTGFQRLIRSRLRFPVNEMQGGVAYGSGKFNVYPTLHGDLDLYGDIFVSADGLIPGPGNTPRRSSLSTAPDTDAVTAQVVSVLSSTPTGETAQWVAGDAGDYHYTVVGANNFGDGPAEAGSAAATITATPTASIVRIRCTVGTGADRPTALKLYRSKVGGTASTEHRFVKSVQVPASNQTMTNNTVDIYDGNNDLPGTSRAYILTTAEADNAIDWVQFLPMMRFNLFPATAAVWPFLVLLFGSVVLRKPERHVILKNIIPENLDWFD